MIFIVLGLPQGVNPALAVILEVLVAVLLALIIIGIIVYCFKKFKKVSFLFASIS